MNWKALVYPRLPSWGAFLHGKKRKGLFLRFFPGDALVCQIEQDRIFWKKFLRPDSGGVFAEYGAGDGVIGSHTLGLELRHGWQGTLWEPSAKARERAKQARRCRVLTSGKDGESENGVDLLAIHRPAEFPGVWEELAAGRIKPRWLVVENREPDPQWAKALARCGFRMRFFIDDDEYFERES